MANKPSCRTPNNSPPITSVPSFSFPRFQELPYELRHLVWSFASPQRILHFRTNDDLEIYLDRRRPLDEHLWLASQCGSAPPITLSINRESRVYALSKYKVLQAPHENLYVDPEVDMWWLDHRNRDRPDYTKKFGTHIPDGSFGLAKEDKKLVKNVLIVLPNTEKGYADMVHLAVSFWVKTLGGAVADVFVASRELGDVSYPFQAAGTCGRSESLTDAGWLNWFESMKDGWEKWVENEQGQGEYGHLARTEHVRLHMLDVNRLGI